MLHPHRDNHRSWFALLMSGVCLGLGCRSQPPAPHAKRPAPAALETIDDVDVLPTAWRYHPPSIATMHHGITLATGTRLLVGKRGERWLTIPNSDENEVAQAQASAFRCPEGIRQILQPSPERFILLGDQGGLYEAHKPLGPLTAMASPHETLSKITFAGGALIGVSILGKVWRGHGQSWHHAQTAPPRLFDIAASAKGALLALNIPETIYASQDGGRHWSTLKTPAIGARALMTSPSGGVLIRGVNRSLHWDQETGALREGQAQDRPPELSQPPETIKAIRGPNAKAVIARRATLSGRYYYEAVESQTGQWQLASGTLDRPLALKPLTLPAMRSCGSVRLGASERQVVYACVNIAADRKTIIADLFRSRDGGQTWQHVATTPSSNTKHIAVAVATDGTTLLTGLCMPGSSPCSPRRPILLNGNTLADTSAPDLVSTAISPVFSVDGHSAYFIGQRAKDNHAALFLSHNGGRRFTSRSLEPSPQHARRWNPAKHTARQLFPGADGELGILLQQSPPVYAVASADGAVHSVAQLPPRTITVSGYGRDVLTAGRDAAQHRNFASWRSLDGGLSFEPVPLPFTLPLDELKNPLRVQCAAQACIIGTRLSRIGWRQADDEPPRPMRGPLTQNPKSQATMRPPIHCTVDESTAWQTIDRSYSNYPPRALQAMRGNSAWSMLRHLPETGEVEAISMRLDPGGAKLVRHHLLKPTANRRHNAYGISPQMEGYAAFRIKLPNGKRPVERIPMPTMDLAWLNYMTNTAVRHSVDGLGQLGRDNITPGDRPSLLLQLVSVSPKHLLVQTSDAPSSLFVIDDQGNRSSPFSYPVWPATSDLKARDDGVVIANHPSAISMHYHSDSAAIAALSIASLEASSPPPRFFAVSPPPHPLREVVNRWSYRGKDVGVATHVLDRTSSRSVAYFAPFAKNGQLGPATAVPTQSDLPNVAIGCTEQQRASTTRMVAPTTPGQLQPIIVKSSSSQIVLISRTAVLHGHPKAPCVAAWTATELNRRHNATTAIVHGLQAIGWLFRPTPAVSRSFDFRPIRCQAHLPMTPDSSDQGLPTP